MPPLCRYQGTGNNRELNTRELKLYFRARKHGVNSKGETVPKKLFPCDVCGKLLTSRLKLQTHVEVIHEGRRDYKCRFCDKTFTSKSNLQIHEGSLHTGVLPYKCEYCSKMFARRNQLNAHKVRWRNIQYIF